MYNMTIFKKFLVRTYFGDWPGGRITIYWHKQGICLWIFWTSLQKCVCWDPISTKRAVINSNQICTKISLSCLTINASIQLLWSTLVITVLILWISSGTFKKYVRSRFPSFDSHSPLVCPYSFSNTLPPSSSRYVVLTTTPRLPLNFYSCEILRKEINNEY